MIFQIYVSSMKLNSETCRNARLSKDKRFDGTFFTAVLTTKIYCRPICPANPPKETNVTYYFSAAAASEAGFRPCLRCRPETAPGSPVWNGTSTTIDRAIALINSGFLNEKSVQELSDYMGVSERHLTRLFNEHIGSSPKKVSTLQRLLFAKQLVIDSSLSITEIAFASGFQSLRRFNDAFLKMFERSPSILRKQKKVTQANLVISLQYRLPFSFQFILSFFKFRGISDVEDVGEDYYARTIRINDTEGSIKITDDSVNQKLLVELHLNQTNDLFLIIQKVKQLFDLNSNLEMIYTHLKNDELLAKCITEANNLPGSWDIFEFSVRAILGQQVSVKAATTFATRIAKKYGKVIQTEGALNLLFPTSHELRDASFEGIGLTKTRTQTLIRFISALNSNQITLELTSDLETFVKQLKTVKGIGDWTANYIAMRGLSDPNAFPDTDLGIIKAMQKHQPEISQKEIVAYSERWKPWRSYATLVLWNSLHED